MTAGRKFGARPVVAALVRRVVSTDGKELDPALVDRTVEDLLGKLENMPRYLGAPMLGMTLAFDLLGVAHNGARFHKQSPEQQKRQLAAWRDAVVPPCRDFVAFYEKMGNFVYFSHVEEQG